MNGRDGGELGFGRGRDRFRREIRESHGQYQPRYDDEKSDYGGAHNPRPGRSGGGNNSPPSRHLWVGNLGRGVTESDLARHFGRFGDLESVAFQPGRSYAFVNFAAEEDAIDAVEALQGFSVAGNPLRIEFAKADKSSSHSRDESYSQRSGIRESPFSQEYRTRHGSHEQPYADNSNLNDKNAEPSPVLWVGFPASLKVDEAVLRRAFAPFGPVEKITAFPGRSYAFVRFENVVSACNAKDALHGKLFGNPRVHICFAKNESRSSTTERGSVNVSPSSHFKFSGRQESSENFRRVGNYSSNNTRTRSPQLFSNPNFPSDPDNETFEQRRFVERDSYDYQSSPMRGKRGHLHDVPQRFPQTNSFQDEQWNYPEDVGFPHEPKRLKTVSYNPERELPEYPYSDHREHEKHGFAGNHHSDFPHQANPSNRNLDGAFGYNKQQISDLAPQREWRDSVDSYQPRPGSVHSVERRNFTPESDIPSLKEWKWEGVIAKGGTPVCRARCFPVGKTLDAPLPEFLDCTARTGLDMLAKHYYQASNAWVVFFVPGSDADIGSYNEFMHYLEEKQRAAVSKLDDTTTLFLVPPSYFSEKVLKVPGKLSMSGVILTLDHTENEDAAKIPIRANTSYPIPNPIPPQHNIPPYLPDFHTNSSHAHGGRSDGGDYPLHGDPRAIPNWVSASSGPYDAAAQRHLSAHDTNSGYSTSGTTGVAGFHPEQLAQLASSLLGQNQVDLRPSDPPPQMNSGPSDSQFGQVQQVQRAPNVPQTRAAEGSQPPLQNSGTAQEEDPQNRLQATLQLAAALLQQIQQGKGS